MEITPELPDGYEGKIKKLTCENCHRLFYVPQEYFNEYDPTLCSECSDIERNHAEAWAIYEKINAFLHRPDTPEQAEIRSIVETEDRKRQGWRMIWYQNLPSEGERQWLVAMSHPISRTHDEIVLNLVFEYSETLITIQNIFPPSRYAS